MKSKPTTAAELMAELEADPTWVADRDVREAARQEQMAELRRAQAPLLAELAAVGYCVQSVWDLVNTATPYPGALPLLLDHLQRAYPIPVREGIARALAVRDANFGWGVLLHLFRIEVEERVKHGIAVALAATADDSNIGDLIGLVSDPRHGTSRVLLLEPIARSREPEAQAAFASFSKDPVLVKEIGFIERRRQRRKR